MARPSTGMIRQNLYLPKQLLARLERRAKLTGLSVSELARRYMEIGFESENAKYARYEETKKDTENERIGT